jgi:hypothetical protein
MTSRELSGLHEMPMMSVTRSVADVTELDGNTRAVDSPSTACGGLTTRMLPTA